MKTVRKLLYREVFVAVAAVTLAFVSLFFFFDLVEELQSVNRSNALGYRIPQALIYIGLMVPSHVYELMPITVLIGSIFVMARFAQSSEFTILRTSGLGPYRALFTLLGLGLVFVVFTFLVGDYVSPAASRQAQLLKARYLGVTSSQGVTGAWLKESRGQNSSVVNVAAMGADGQLVGIRIFEFDEISPVVL